MNATSIRNQEKNQAALSSVVAAVFLTTLKIVVGVATGSLGILSEAAHSGLDLVAALVTFFAVRTADRPADDDHHYGHGKIENLSALFETFLLLITCVWIIYEAVQRLFFEVVEVEASFWAFAVMGVSIAVDVSRSRMLSRVAKKHNSQALEADALHFGTDIWSSSVVIVGLVLVKIAELRPNLAFLAQADAVAAVGVALIVVLVSIRLGKRTVAALLDTAPAGLADEITHAVAELPAVFDCHQVRVRPSGPQLFVEVHVTLEGALPLVQSHALTKEIEALIGQLAPNSDVTVHAEPAGHA